MSFGILPDSVSWKDQHRYSNRNVDQASCGSCWAFTTATTLEALDSIHNDRDKPQSFSVQYLLDCDDTNFGCDGGWMTDAYNWTATNGVVKWDDYYKGY